jgi:hypothetical protein
VTAHRRTGGAAVAPDPPSAGGGGDDALPFDCVATAAAGSVELTIMTPGCFGVDREGIRVDWKGGDASMRSIFDDGKDASAVPRAALVGFLAAVADRGLLWSSTWERCRQPWGHLQVEARWTCNERGGSTVRGYSTTDYPLCGESGRNGDARRDRTDGETIRSLVRSFRERWRAGPPAYVGVRARPR